MRRILFLAVLLIAFQAPLVAQSPSPPATLQPGDKVVIQVWQRPELSGEFDVALDGRILHPLYQGITVTGMPANQIDGAVREFLSRYEANPQVVVQPMIRVAVAGAVGMPDVHLLPPGATVGQAVAVAGGVTPEGKLNDVRILRESAEIKVDLTDARSWSQPVRSGDQIMVKLKGGSLFRDVVLPLFHFAGTIANLVNIAIN